MKTLLRLSVFSAFLISSVSTFAWSVPDETLHYGVRFKWGFIDANVGIATLTTTNIPTENRFVATLSGKSIDLFGHYYAAGDTIVGSIIADPVRPVETADLYTEKGEFAIQTITCEATGPSKDGPVVEHLPNGDVLRSRVSNYGSGLTIDLLAVFYYMRQFDYGLYQPGQSFTINLSNGSAIETLSIIYQGIENVGVDGTDVGAYHIYLTFTDASNGKSDNMNVWIATDANRTPLIINGSLSVGHMECRLVPGNI